MVRQKNALRLGVAILCTVVVNLVISLRLIRRDDSSRKKASSGCSSMDNVFNGAGCDGSHTCGPTTFITRQDRRGSQQTFVSFVLVDCKFQVSNVVVIPRLKCFSGRSRMKIIHSCRRQSLGISRSPFFSDVLLKQCRKCFQSSRNSTCCHLSTTLYYSITAYVMGMNSRKMAYKFAHKQA